MDNQTRKAIDEHITGVHDSQFNQTDWTEQYNHVVLLCEKWLTDEILEKDYDGLGELVKKAAKSYFKDTYYTEEETHNIIKNNSKQIAAKFLTLYKQQEKKRSKKK